VVAVNVLLHRVTGADSYLAEARRLADAALQFFSGGFSDPYYSAAGAGVGPYPGRGIFNAIFFRNLLLLHAVQPTYVPPSGVSYLQRIQAYADTAWGDFAGQGQPGVRDQRTGLFKLHGDAEYSLLDQAGMVQVYASLAATPAAVCDPRPAVGVTAVPDGSARLRVTISAGTGSAVPGNRLFQIRATIPANARVDMVGGTSNLSGQQSLPIGNGTQPVVFVVRRTSPGAVTIPLVVTDTCGEWKTFVGGGPTAF
jgi:hypothetical protein